MGKRRKELKILKMYVKKHYRRRARVWERVLMIDVPGKREIQLFDYDRFTERANYLLFRKPRTMEELRDEEKKHWELLTRMSNSGNGRKREITERDMRDAEIGKFKLLLRKKRDLGIKEILKELLPICPVGYPVWEWFKDWPWPEDGSKKRPKRRGRKPGKK